MHVDVLRTAQEKLACLQQHAVAAMTARIKKHVRLGNTDSRYKRSKNPDAQQEHSLAPSHCSQDIGEGEDSDQDGSDQEFSTAASNQEETSTSVNESSSPLDRDDVDDDSSSVHSKRVGTPPAPFGVCECVSVHE